MIKHLSSLFYRLIIQAYFLPKKENRSVPTIEGGTNPLFKFFAKLSPKESVAYFLSKKKVGYIFVTSFLLFLQKTRFVLVHFLCQRLQV